jgi:DNA-binding transcriptional regulator LsrR (DeoR family)
LSEHGNIMLGFTPDEMPAERVSMGQMREVLRLRFASELAQRAIAKSLGLSQGSG